MSDLSTGGPVNIAVYGASPGETVLFGSSRLGRGAGPCPSSLGGSCLGIRQPGLLGTAVADADGVAVFSFASAPMSAGTDVCVQAGIVGAGAGAGAVSEIECRTVLDLPFVDGVCPTTACPGLCDQGTCLLSYEPGIWSELEWADDRLFALHHVSERFYLEPTGGPTDTADTASPGNWPTSPEATSRFLEIDPARGVYRTLHSFQTHQTSFEEDIIVTGDMAYHTARSVVLGQTWPANLTEIRRTDKARRAIPTTTRYGHIDHYQGQIWGMGGVYDPVASVFTPFAPSQNFFTLQMGSSTISYRDNFGTGDLWADDLQGNPTWQWTETAEGASRPRRHGDDLWMPVYGPNLRWFRIDLTGAATLMRTELDNARGVPQVPDSRIDGDDLYDLVFRDWQVDRFFLRRYDIATNTEISAQGFDGAIGLRAPGVNAEIFTSLLLEVSPDHVYLSSLGRLMQTDR